jgi:NTE family protein
MHLKKMLCIFILLLTGCTSSYPTAATPSEIPSFQPKHPVHTVLVLGGGGSKGLAHLGAIRELEAAGIRPDLIIGCSAGAIVGALYADEPDISTIDQTLLGMKRADMLDTTYFSSRFGFVKGKALEAFMKKNLRSKTFEELKIPLIVIATDLHTGELIELSHNEIPIAVRASCAYPGVFQPVPLEGRYLVDGGVTSPLPVEIAKKYGAQVIIAIDVSEKLTESKPSHFFGVAKRAMEIAYTKFVSHALALADIAIKMDFQDMGTFSDHLNQKIYEHGRSKAKAAIPEIKKKLDARSQTSSLPTSSLADRPMDQSVAEDMGKNQVPDIVAMIPKMPTSKR